MKKKLITMWTFNILMWICWAAALITRIFSTIAYWILLGCWLVFAIANIITCIIIDRSIKREEQKTIKEWDEIFKKQWEGYATNEDIKPSVTIKLADKADDGTKE